MGISDQFKDKSQELKEQAKQRAQDAKREAQQRTQKGRQQRDERRPGVDEDARAAQERADRSYDV
ncbi:MULTISPECIES: hypothetical protein [unclassified Streptomyces]|uniref:hypothetical protein n=1 Tax=unclassified Streptomyces TaxID=2593676 RepID=UPI0033BBE29B